MLLVVAHQLGAVCPALVYRNSNRKEPCSSTIQPGCSIRVALRQPEIPPVWANSNETVDAVAAASNGHSQPARLSGWSGPYGEEFAPDKYASAMPTELAELLTFTVSSPLRRNVLGAIASAKNDRNFP
jgi:hypothetical protein